MALSKIQAAGLTADLIDETKLADNSIDSEHYNDGSIDNAHLADDAVGVAELSATGTAGNTTYLRGDNTWTVPPDTNTTYSVQDGQLSENNFTNADHSKLDGIAASANNYIHPNHSGDVTSSADGATTIADNAVTLAKMAGGTDGQIITYDANGDPIAVGPGTDGQVLTSTGAGSPPAFEDAAGGVDNVTSDAYGIIVQTTNTGNDSMVLVKANEAKDAQIRLYADEADEAADMWRITASASDGTLSIQNYAGGAWENSVKCYGNGAVKFYKDNTLMCETSNDGLKFPDGKGIDFSADANNGGMDNELLDDYEEGYFTFTMDSENGDAWTSRAGYTKMRYVKVGKMVTFSGKYETNSTSGSPSGRLQITNLPFASIAATSDASNTRAFHGYVKGMSSDSNMIMHLWWMGANSTTLLLHSFSNDNNGDMQSFGTSQLATSTVWEGDVTGTYFTSS